MNFTRLHKLTAHLEVSRWSAHPDEKSARLSLHEQGKQLRLLRREVLVQSLRILFGFQQVSEQLGHLEPEAEEAVWERHSHHHAQTSEKSELQSPESRQCQGLEARFRV